MKVSRELQEKIDKLQEYDDRYYNGAPLVTDAAYDLFKDTILRQLPPDHPLLDKIGHPVSSGWPKEQHVMFMGSQNKIDNEEGIRAWIKKATVSLAEQGPEYVLQHKLDGFSLELIYEGGKLQKAVTRGDGVIGENITSNARLFRHVPSVLPIDKKVICRGEGIIQYEDYRMIQKESGDHYKNVRNAASGISRRFDGKYSKYIRFLAYDLKSKVHREQDTVKLLKRLGFETVKTYLCGSEDRILEIYRHVKDTERKDYPYQIDGLVLKLDLKESQDKLGIKHGRPEGQVALKFESNQAVTKVKDIIYQIGRSGKITPVAVLEPVELMGSTIRKTTLHNFSYIESNRITIGAEVTLEKKGDIIPQVVEVLLPGKEFKKPEKCPSCGGPVVDDGVNIWCRNSVCRERDINKIVYWVQSLDMKGFSKKFIEKLWDTRKIQSISDIYRLTPDDFVSMDGIGTKTVQSFFKVLDSTSEMYLENFLVALGIPACSKVTAGVLVENFGDWETISGIDQQRLEDLSGFAETSARALCDGIAEIKEMGDELLEVIKIKEKKTGVLTGSSFCVTGSLSSMSRKEFQEKIVEHGGTYKGSVAAGLTYLVTNDPSSMSSKNKKAKKLGVEILSEKDFLDMIGEHERKSEEQEKDTGEVRIISENLF